VLIAPETGRVPKAAAFRIKIVIADGGGFSSASLISKARFAWGSAMATNVVMTIVMAVSTDTDAYTDATNMNPSISALATPVPNRVTAKIEAIRFS